MSPHPGTTRNLQVSNAAQASASASLLFIAFPVGKAWESPSLGPKAGDRSLPLHLCLPLRLVLPVSPCLAPSLSVSASLSLSLCLSLPLIVSPYLSLSVSVCLTLCLSPSLCIACVFGLNPQQTYSWMQPVPSFATSGFVNKENCQGFDTLGNPASLRPHRSLTVRRS